MGTKSSKEAKLTKEDLEFLVKTTGHNEETLKEFHQDFLKDCPSGRLSKAKFTEMYKKFFPSGDGDQLTQHMFRVFDTDGKV